MINHSPLPLKKPGRMVVTLCLIATCSPFLASAQELGANDALISGDFLLGTTFTSLFPALAHNPIADNYLVVWEERYRHLGCAEGVVTSEIHQRVVDGTTGAPVGEFQTAVSSMGDTCDSFDAREPAVAYNSRDNEYFVVWSGSDDVDGGLADEYEIFGQRLNGETGFATGIRSRRLTEVGGVGAASPDAVTPAVAYNAIDNEFLLVYRAELSIEARVLDSAGTTVAGPFRLSPAGTFGFEPAVGWSGIDNEYLVVWTAVDGSNPGSAMLALHLDSDGLSTSPVYPVSDPGQIPAYEAAHRFPDVAYDPLGDQFLVVWERALPGARVSTLESEIVVQRVSGEAQTLGENQVISETGAMAGAPAVAHSATDDRFLVTWTASEPPDGYEVWGQWLDGSGEEILDQDFRLSDLGGVTNAFYNGGFPAVAWQSSGNEYLVVWYGSDNISGGPEGGGLPLDSEIYGQRVSARVFFSDYFERGDLLAWSKQEP